MVWGFIPVWQAGNVVQGIVRCVYKFHSRKIRKTITFYDLWVLTVLFIVGVIYPLVGEATSRISLLFFFSSFFPFFILTGMDLHICAMVKCSGAFKKNALEFSSCWLTTWFYLCYECFVSDQLSLRTIPITRYLLLRFIRLYPLLFFIEMNIWYAYTCDVGWGCYVIVSWSSASSILRKLKESTNTIIK